MRARMRRWQNSFGSRTTPCWAVGSDESRTTPCWAVGSDESRTTTPWAVRSDGSRTTPCWAVGSDESRTTPCWAVGSDESRTTPCWAVGSDESRTTTPWAVRSDGSRTTPCWAVRSEKRPRRIWPSFSSCARADSTTSRGRARRPASSRAVEGPIESIQPRRTLVASIPAFWASSRRSVAVQKRRIDAVPARSIVRGPAGANQLIVEARATPAPAEARSA